MRQGLQSTGERLGPQRLPCQVLCGPRRHHPSEAGVRPESCPHPGEGAGLASGRWGGGSRRVEAGWGAATWWSLNGLRAGASELCGCGEG